MHKYLHPSIEATFGRLCFYVSFRALWNITNACPSGHAFVFSNVRRLTRRGHILFRPLRRILFRLHILRLRRKDKHRKYCIGKIRFAVFSQSLNFLSQVLSALRRRD